MTKIAFIGLGNMGSGMAANLVKSGFEVWAYDLSNHALAKAQDNGCIPSPCLFDAVSGAAAVITMLPNGNNVQSIYLGVEGIIENSPSSCLFIDCSTIDIATARLVADAARANGNNFLDAPVSGGVGAAVSGGLTFMVGGESAAFEQARPIFDAMGKRIFHAGKSGNGQAAKLCNNMLLGISMIGTCEAFNLAKAMGLDTQAFFDISSVSSGQNWSMTSYCPAPGPVPNAPSNNEYRAGFAASMMLKDLRLAHEAAVESKTNIPLGAFARALYERMDSEGFGAQDFSYMIQFIQDFQQN